MKAVFNWGAKHTFSDTFSIIMTLKFQKSAGLFSFNLWQIMILRTLKKNSQFRNRCCTFSYKSNSVININVTYVFLLRIDEAKIRIENFSEHIKTHIYLSQKGRSYCSTLSNHFSNTAVEEGFSFLKYTSKKNKTYCIQTAWINGSTLAKGRQTNCFNKCLLCNLMNKSVY